MKNESRKEVRKAILNQEKPFCIAELLFRMEVLGFNDSELVVCVLNELFAEGMVEYKEIHKDTRDINDEENWAFAVA